MSIYKKILIPFDGSGPSKKAAEHALNLAKDQNAEIVGLKAINLTGEVISPSDSLWDTISGDLQDKAKDILSELTALAEEKNVDITLELREGNPEREIVEFAEEWGADIIVMGTSGRSGFGRVLLGSTANRVIATAPCPVTVLH